jgi:molecular chaperone GrpE
MGKKKKKAKNLKPKIGDNINQQSTINNQQSDGNNDTSEKQQEAKVEVKEIIKETNVDYKDKWLRAQADYQNLVKETNDRRSQLVQMSELQILEEFIPVYDNLGKALTTDFESTDSTDMDKQFENWKKGVEFIKKQFGDVLKNHGVEEIKTVGENFNPELHETVGEEESEEETGIILKEVDGGYIMKDKVIKVAKVIITK